MNHVNIPFKSIQEFVAELLNVSMIHLHILRSNSTGLTQANTKLNKVPDQQSEINSKTIISFDEFQLTNGARVPLLRPLSCPPPLMSGKILTLGLGLFFLT